MHRAPPAWLDQVLLLYVALVGACAGSFVNVVVSRLPHQLSVVKPRSRCPRCARTLPWFDNVPIVSYLWLRGRCRACEARIAPRYLIVECLSAALSAALLVRLGPTWTFVAWWALAMALLAIAFLDIDYFWVPDALTYPGIAWAFLSQLWPGRMGAVAALWGLVPALMLWGVAWTFGRATGREGMGQGDIKLLAMLGLALGLADGFTMLLLAALQGAAMGTLIVATGGHRQASVAGAMPKALIGDDWQPEPHAVPFGPFLTLAAFEVVLLPEVFGAWPQHLTQWIVDRL